MDLFKKEYSREEYLNFLQNKFLPEDFERSNEEVQLPPGTEKIKKINLMGTCPGIELKVYEIEHSTPSDSRVTVTRELFRLMKAHGDYQAIVMIRSSRSDFYRLSYLTMGVRVEDKHLKYEFSNPRRYSFLLGPGTKTKTPEQYLVNKGRVKSLEDLEERFSVEVVNKEFYEHIAVLFSKLVGGERGKGKNTKSYTAKLKLPGTSDRQVMQEFAVRLIGRIIFCWFLTKKKTDDGDSLIPQQILSLESVIKHRNYYHEILENLFFQVLNTPWDQRDENFRKFPYSGIPFLNGGLFEPQTHDFYDFDNITGVSKSVGTLIVPDPWLKELFEVLETYNFTIDENTTIDVDLSVDPEMLGRIFENLLAEINPETGETARKSTGSYYTPRAIVDYMVDESLKQYLKTKAEIDEEKLDNIISYSRECEDLTPQDKVKIINALDEMKIIDPACGSGAFPMGILQKCVWILNRVDPDGINWIIKKLDRIQDPTHKKETENKLMKKEWDYVRKLGIIQESIYGVDIQSIAVEIAKLRTFLSLIVDEKIETEKDNLGIEPLPNLEFKYVAANSLIGLPEKKGELFEDRENIKKLEDIRDKYFQSFGDEKKNLESEFRKVQQDMFTEGIRRGSMGSRTEKLSLWNPFGNESTGWFDPEWMFGVKGGFDIVIGNPPYIKEYTDRKAFEPIKGKKYYQGKMDIWYYFACVGIDLLSENGIICFIATNNWTTNAGASILRNKILDETKLEKFIDFGSYMIFESAAIQTMIFIIRKSIADNYLLDYRKIEKYAANLTDVNKILNKEKGNYLYETIDFKKDKWLNKNFNFENTDIEFILEKIKSKSNFSLDSRKEVAQGIVSPQDFLNKSNQNLLGSSYVVGEGIFNLNNDELKILDLEKNELELIKPFYSTNELGKYYGNPDNHLWIIYTGSEFKDERRIRPYPNIKKHLDRFKTVITSDNKPYGLHRTRNENFFKGEKIISLRKCASPTFTYTDFDCYVSQTFFVIKSHRINLKYLTGLLNSKLIAFWLWHRGKLQGDFYQVDKEPLLEIPLIKDESKSKLFGCLVDFIIYCISKQVDSSIMGQILDALVFSLYFPDHMQEREIDVIEFVESDIEKAMNGREFEKLNDTEKEQVIEQLHQTWSHPDSEVRNRIKLFAVRSPEILKPILES